MGFLIWLLHVVKLNPVRRFVHERSECCLPLEITKENDSPAFDRSFLMFANVKVEKDVRIFSGGTLLQPVRENRL